MILAPGATIGILGSGQLGRMLAMAALKLGLRCHIYAPENDAPAYDAASERTVAAFDDEAALARFADAVDVITYEFENVPISCVEFLARRKPVRPDARALAATQDRLAEKTFLRGLGLATAPFCAVPDAASLAPALLEVGRPAVLKTLRFGYDGKGQAMIREGSDLPALHRSLGGGPMILEGFVGFDCEASVVVARSLEGAMVAYDLCENEHDRHILRALTSPRASPRGSRRPPRRWPPRRSKRWTMSACWRSNCSSGATRRAALDCWSTNWRRGSTIQATGRSRALKLRSSSSTFGRSPVGRWAARRAGGESRCRT